MVDDENVKLCLLTTEREWAGITKISREGNLPIWLLLHFVLSTGSYQVFEIVCYKRSSEDARVSFRHTFQFSSSFQSSPKSQVLEDPELKGRCGDLWNERFVPSSDNGKNYWAELFRKGHISAEFHRNENHQTADFLSKDLIPNARKVFHSALEIPNGRREEE